MQVLKFLGSSLRGFTVLHIECNTYLTWYSYYFGTLNVQKLQERKSENKAQIEKVLPYCRYLIIDQQKNGPQSLLTEEAPLTYHLSRN